MSTLKGMKKTPVPVPPRPKTRPPSDKDHTVVMHSFYGIVYRFDQDNKWQNVVKDYTKIDIVDCDLPNDPYKLIAASGDQKILDFVITSSTKANAKGTFVKWSNENSTHGARFSKPDVAQEFCDQLCAIAMDLLARANRDSENLVNGFQKQDTARSGVVLPSRKESTTSVDSNSYTGLSQSKASTSTIKIDLLLSNNESRQLSLDKETLVSGLLDKICKDERLSQSFYTIHYVNQANTPVPLACKVANLDSCLLRLVDKRDLHKSLSLDTRKTVGESMRLNLTTERVRKGEGSTSRSKVDKDFALDVSDPLVKAFLDMANIHQYELKKPRVHSLVEEFIANRGGLQYLKQLRDSKLSRQTLDEIGEISQKVLSLAESPTKFDHQYNRVSSVRETWSHPEGQYDLRRAYSVGSISPVHEMEKKNSLPTKKKRQAPLPPGQPRPLTHADSWSSLTVQEDKDAGAKSAEPQRVKRKAPLPPAAVKEVQKVVSPTLSSVSTTSSAEPSFESTPPFSPVNRPTSADIVRQASRGSSDSPVDQASTVKSPPTFLAPPPPDDPPPNEVYSPVGPLSATTPSPTKDFKFMGELAKRLEVRRSLIVHSDDEESVDYQPTPQKGYDSDTYDTPTKGSMRDWKETPKKQQTSGAPPYTSFKDSAGTPVKVQNRAALTTEATPLDATTEGTLKESPKVTLNANVDEAKNESVVKVDKKPLKGGVPKDIAERENEDINAGYTVDLLENQMKTILHSIKLLDNTKDEKQKEVLLKPLLLQQTILQKMIDQEKKNATHSVEIEDSLVVNSRLSPSNVVENEAENPVLSANYKELDTTADHKSDKNKKRKKLLPNIDLTKEDVLVVNEEFNIGDVDNGRDAMERDRLTQANEERLQREEEEKRKLEEIELKREEEIRKKIEGQKQKDIEEEKRRFEEQKRHIEDEKRRKIELERQRQEEEKNRLAAEKLQEQIRKQKEYLKQKEIMEQQWRMERERKEAEQRKREEEEQRKREEAEQRTREEIRKQEEYQRIAEERRNIELQKQEMELARREKEEERKRLEEEVRKFKIEEQRRKEEEEAQKKKEEMQELERLRKELELQKKIESERLEKERKEIEELRRQLKEQRELQEKEALEREILEQKRRKDAKTKPVDVETQDVELFNVVKDINLEEESCESPSSIVIDKSGTGDTGFKDNDKKETNGEEDVTSTVIVESRSEETYTEATEESCTTSMKPDLEQINKSRVGSKPNTGMRRPSSSLVSSALRTADGEASKKPATGLYAKIQQMAKAKVNNGSEQELANAPKEPVESNSDNPNDQRTEQVYPKKKIPSGENNASLHSSAAIEAKSNESNVNDRALSLTEEERSEEHQKKSIQHKKDEINVTKKFPICEKQAASEVKDVSNSNELNGPTSATKSELQQPQVANFKPFNSNPPTAFKSIAFRPTTSFMAKLKAKENTGVVNSENATSETRKMQETVTTAPVNSQLKASNQRENKQTLKDVQQDASTTKINEIKKSDANLAQNQTDSKILTHSADAEIFVPKGIYLPGFTSASPLFTNREQNDIDKDILSQKNMGFDLQDNLGDYRPKCISPDDLRSSLVLEKEKLVEANPKASSSASILRNSLDKKAPPKVLPKTLPKTLPKPGSKTGEVTDKQGERESVKRRIQNFNQQKPEAKEKKKERINIAAIPNRSLEISSGAIASNIMNKNIQHDDKKGFTNLPSSDRGRAMPYIPKADSKSDDNVTSEPVQAPSLLRRLSQNSIPIETGKSNISPRTSPAWQAALTQTEIKEMPKSDEVPNEATDIEVQTSTDKTDEADSMRIGNYASIIDVNQNEKSQRDTVTVKKVGGLKIGFGRDKPKVFNT